MTVRRGGCPIHMFPVTQSLGGNRRRVKLRRGASDPQEVEMENLQIGQNLLLKKVKEKYSRRIAREKSGGGKRRKMELSMGAGDP